MCVGIEIRIAGLGFLKQAGASMPLYVAPCRDAGSGARSGMRSPVN